VTVPLLDLRLQYAAIRDDVLAAVTRVCDSQQFILGPEVARFEAAVAAMAGVPHAIGVSSGTDALLVSLMALGVGPGDEVIVPTYSFFATAGSVARLGATPIFVDVEPGTLTIDAAAAAAAVGPRTRAIVPVHLFGQCADMRGIEALADASRLAIVEDAAQALGATYEGRPAGAIGRAGCFSFFPSKNLGAFGDAGLVTTGDAAFAERVRRLRNHGAEPKYAHAEIGGNFRLDAIQAAVLGVKLPHLAGWTSRRQANAARYRTLVREAGLDGRMALPEERPGRTHVYHQFVIRVPDRDRVRAHLSARGVGTEIYYPVPLHRQTCFQAFASARRACPVAEAAAAESLALPIYPELTPAQQEYVVSALAEVLA
jgi:dTDP-4-amino-4,6-dideoxygalactose transaminase